MTVYIYHTIVRATTNSGKYKRLNNALKAAKNMKIRWANNNIYWMRCWIGE